MVFGSQVVISLIITIAVHISYIRVYSQKVSTDKKINDKTICESQPIRVRATHTLSQDNTVT